MFSKLPRKSSRIKELQASATQPRHFCHRVKGVRSGGLSSLLHTQRLILVLTGVIWGKWTSAPDIFFQNHIVRSGPSATSERWIIINQSFMKILVMHKMVDWCLADAVIQCRVTLLLFDRWAPPVQIAVNRTLRSAKDAVFVPTIKSLQGQWSPELPTVNFIPTASRERLLSTHCRSNCLQALLCLHKQGILSHRSKRAQLKPRLQLTWWNSRPIHFEQKA